MAEKEVPESHPAEPILAALGSFTYAWSGLQAALETLVWALLVIDEQRGRIITSNMPMQALIDMLQTILNEISIPKDQKPMFNNLVTGLRKLNEERVNIMHSHWSLGHDLEKFESLKASRNIARGQLKKKEKHWTREELMNLAIATAKMGDSLLSLAASAKDASVYHANKANSPTSPS